MTYVRKATSRDGGRVAAALASAFGADPVVCWMSGQDDSERRMRPFWRSFVGAALRKSDHEVYMDDDGSGAAVWRGVDAWKVPTTDVVRSLPAMVRSFRGRAPLALQLLARMEKQHPSAPHYYLEFLGTRRDRQNKGIGTALLQPMLERCDAEGIAAYLESSNPRNVPFYARHGFREGEAITAPRGGPTLVTMWRDPRG